MKTEYLDSELQRLSILEKQGALSVFGRETLIEFKAIKQALTIPDVSNTLDLHELDKRLSEVLDSETADSLISWLNMQRQ
jgi:hypothetical protein